MNGPYLESGTLTEFQPLGAGGDTLFGSARELRAAIARRLGAEVAACFAIPQQNANGDTLDWYAPEPGAAIPWSELDHNQRADVEERLRHLRTQLAALSHDLISGDGESDIALQTFGRLLAHAGTIPDISHVFSVGGRPVLAFWGFRLRDKEPNTPTLWDREPVRPAPNVEPPTGTPSRANAGDEDRSHSPTRPVAPVASASKTSSAPVEDVSWGLLALVALAFLLMLLEWPRDKEEPAAPTLEASAEALAIPSEAIEAGSLDFLSGNWQATSDALKDSITGQPLAFAYELDGEEGEILITEPDGGICRAPVNATFDGDALILRPRTAIVCPPPRDPFFGTTLTCRPSTDGRTECTGAFPDGKRFRVDMRRRQVIQSQPPSTARRYGSMSH